MSIFRPATKEQSKGHVALLGPAGSGKSYTGLIVATLLADRGKVAALDSERGSLSKYADKFRFDVFTPSTFSPQTYTSAIKEAEAAGYGAILIDSLSHAWMGPGGALEMADNAKAKSGNNSFAAWRHVTPAHNALVDALTGSAIHVVVTCRVKMEHVIVEENGKKTVKKLGLAPIQRDGLEYEFDLLADLTVDQEMMVSKTRCDAMRGLVVQMPTAKTFQPFKEWLNSGTAPAAKADPAPPEPDAKARYAQVLAAAREWLGEAEHKTATASLLKAFGWVPKTTPTMEQLNAVADLIEQASRNGMTLAGVLERQTAAAGGAQ